MALDLNTHFSLASRIPQDPVANGDHVSVLASLWPGLRRSSPGFESCLDLLIASSETYRQLLYCS